MYREHSLKHLDAKEEKYILRSFPMRSKEIFACFKMRKI